MQFFSELFQLRGGVDPQDPRIQRCGVELTWIMVMSLVDKALPRLTEEDRQALRALAGDQCAEQVLAILRQRYSDIEWEAFLRNTLEPLIIDYEKRVLKAET